MKILRVIPSMDPVKGGPIEGIRNSIIAFETIGITNDVVCLDIPEKKYPISYPFSITKLGPIKSSWQFSSHLKEWLLKNLLNYDVVIIHGMWLYPGYATMSAIRKLKRTNSVPKLYVIPHGMLDPYFQKDAKRRLKSVRNYFYWMCIERKVVNRADGLLFTSDQEMDLAKTTFPFYRPKKEFNIGYGILPPQTAISTEMEVRDINNEPYFLFLSRIHPKKGIDILIEAYTRVSDLKRNRLPKLKIAGPGIETDFGKKLLVKSSESNARIEFLGMVTGESKWKIMSEAVAFILPSHQENFGIAVVESLACGVPVLISNKVNIWKEISESEAGLICENNLPGIQNQLLAYLSLSAEAKKKLQENSLICFNAKFNLLNNIERFRDMLITNQTAN